MIKTQYSPFCDSWKLYLALCCLTADVMILTTLKIEKDFFVYRFFFSLDSCLDIQEGISKSSWKVELSDKFMWVHKAFKSMYNFS